MPTRFAPRLLPRRLIRALACAGVAIAMIGAARSAIGAPPAAACASDDLIAGKLPWQQRDVSGNPALVTDGNVAADGAVWDAPAAIKLEGGLGSLTYDLGKPTTVAAFVLQADANDSY